MALVVSPKREDPGLFSVTCCSLPKATVIIKMFSEFNPFHSGYWVLFQTAKTQVKCEMPPYALVSTVCQDKNFSGTEIYHFIESLIGNPLKYKKDEIQTYCINMSGVIQIKRVKQ